MLRTDPFMTPLRLVPRDEVRKSGNRVRVLDPLGGASSQPPFLASADDSCDSPKMVIHLLPEAACGYGATMTFTWLGAT